MVGLAAMTVSGLQELLWHCLSSISANLGCPKACRSTFADHFPDLNAASSATSSNGQSAGRGVSQMSALCLSWPENGPSQIHPLRKFKLTHDRDVRQLDRYGL